MSAMKAYEVGVYAVGIVLNRLVLFNVLDIETTTPIYYS